MTHSLAMQIAEIEREITMRKSVYPRLIAKHAMRASHAQMQIAIMESVLATLRELKSKEVIDADAQHPDFGCR